MKSVNKKPRKSVKKGKCKTLVQEKIRINIEEYKKGKFVSRAQAIAVAYSQVAKENPYCRRFLKRKNSDKPIKKTLKKPQKSKPKTLKKSTKTLKKSTKPLKTKTLKTKTLKKTKSKPKPLKKSTKSKRKLRMNGEGSSNEKVSKGKSSRKPNALGNINFVIHETTIEGFKAIMKSKELLTNNSRKERGLCMKGQGCYNRRLGPLDASLTDKKFYNTYDEAYGSFFRVVFDDSFENHESYDYNSGFDDVCLVFSKDLLNKDNWILNTTENFGFYLNSPGSVGESSFTGRKGITYDSSNIDEFPPEHIRIRKNDTELLIKDDIDLSCLIEVIFKNKSDYEKYKHLVPKNVNVSYTTDDFNN
jgi:hypothetical protein